MRPDTSLHALSQDPSGVAAHALESSHTLTLGNTGGDAHALWQPAEPSTGQGGPLSLRTAVRCEPAAVLTLTL